MTEHQYAGFWIRFVAFLIDIIFLTVVVTVPLSFLYNPECTTESGQIDMTCALMNIMIPLILTIFFWLRFLGTPGKILLELKVVDAQTFQALSLVQAVVRYFAYILSIIPFGFGFIWIAIDKKRQAWHDKLAKSVVIKGDISQSSSTDMDS